MGKILFRNGGVLLNAIYDEQTEFDLSVNKLLLIGFYLLNFGFIVYAPKYKGSLRSFRDVFEGSSKQLRKIILILRSVRFTNLMVFVNLKKSISTELNI